MKRFAFGCMVVLALVVSAYALVAYGALPLGQLVGPEMRANFQVHRFGIYTHVFAASIALALGPFQFSERLRRRFPRLHRTSGRIYLGAGVGLGGLAGLYMSTFAYGGLVSKSGFAALALAWLYSGWRAYRAIRAGNVAEHRRWMTRNFALTLAAVTLRILLPVSAISGIPFALAYPVIAWLSWVPNLLVAEWAVVRKIPAVRPDLRHEAVASG
ncbi:DUF2306 domain-containing protein [Thermomonas carbonis]|uniref:DUF2306 domain-containing protein n=1 Tax=Thermomonas carbonis TaxID=1463158 RepID=A0A7G9STQ1_9GAMM|nr:DUF2306 domain-containing protein [Thermomonas carbonis]QNN71226.1 DUF2306 domain-containing protein [Thermomonas carbonis]GHC11073.1 hypothetical protein GCM10010080_28450 [Thermomonas carbonis]